MTASTERHSFDTLDLLRGVAAACVLVWHFVPIGGKNWWSAYLSVDLFFVLSGVVIAHAYEHRLCSGWGPRRFLLTRVIRLWPLYLLGSAVGACAVVADIVLNGGTHPWQFKPLAAAVLHAALLWPQLQPPTAPAFPLNRNAWSLFAELAVNIGYGLGGYRLGNRALGGVALMGAAVVGWGAFHFADWDSALNLGGLAIHLDVGLGGALYSFPVGVLIYRAWRLAVLPRIRAHPVVLALAFVALLFVTPAEGPAAPFASCLAVWLAIPLLVIAAVQSASQGRTRLVARVGGTLSYPIYVLQDGFYLFAALLTVRHITTPIVAYTLAATLIVVLAPMTDRFFDRPTRRWLSRAAGMRAALPALASTL